MFDRIKSIFSRGKELADSDYKRIYSELNEIVDNPVKYAQARTSFSGPMELRNDFRQAGVSLPDGWSPQEAYYITRRQVGDRKPDGKSPKEVKDMAVRISLVGMGVSMGGHIGLDIAGAIIQEYEENSNYNWPQAGKSALKKIKKGKY